MSAIGPKASILPGRVPNARRAACSRTFAAKLSPWLMAAGLGLAALSAPSGPAYAGPDTSGNDAEVEVLIQSVFEAEYPKKQYVEALEKLQLASEVCQQGSCSAKVRAKVLVAVATVLAGGLDQKKDAIEVFRIALKEDAKVDLLKGFDKGPILDAWNSAHGGKPIGPTEEPRKKYPGGMKAPKGWKSAEAFFYSEEATKAKADKKWALCAGYADDSLAVETRSSTRYLKAQCLDGGNKWLEAKVEYDALAKDSGDIGKKSQDRAAEISGKAPKLSFRKPTNAEELVVSIDDVQVADDQLGNDTVVNPGPRRIRASGKVNGQKLVFDREFTLQPGESKQIDIQLVPQTDVAKDNRVLKCLEESKSREELAECIGQGQGRPVNVKIGVELSGYHDDDNTDVISPAISLVVDSPTGGWTLGGSFLVDVVTTASTDIIATASPRWTETRYVPAIFGRKKFGDFAVGLSAGASIEPDYLSLAAGANASADLLDKRVTPSLAYGFGYDIQGRSGTSFDAFSTVILQNSVDAGVSIVADKSTVVTVSSTAVFQTGDTSKPYRYVPLFSEDVVAQIPPGLVREEVDRVRSQVRALEQLPTERYRFAVAGRVAHRLESQTLRIDERLYIDNWGLKASTTDAMFLVDVDRVRFWPHVRFHAQTGTDFWQIAYPVVQDAGEIVLPNYRTGDRELGPFIAAYGGGGVKVHLGAERNFALAFVGDVVYTRYLNHLFILERLGFFGALGAEVEIE
ncbi:MAG: DUF3570 domain-containing protein [Polyangiaceae bacterium]|nr:DUF3570 domain-containing protein [Polyangiaceae bacterium]